ncbi:MAG TPA: hypothetical protein VIS06_07570 [Mycobacteriales bacterium]
MEGTDTSRAISHATWWGAGMVGSGLAVLVLSFRPWFALEAAQKGADLGTVLPVEQTGWGSALGALAVLASVLGGGMALLPSAATRGLYLWPAAIGAVLALVRMGLPPDATLLGESLSYTRTIWVILVAAFAVVEVVCGVLCASLRNQEHLG